MDAGVNAEDMDTDEATFVVLLVNVTCPPDTAIVFPAEALCDQFGARLVPKNHQKNQRY